MLRASLVGSAPQEVKRTAFSLSVCCLGCMLKTDGMLERCRFRARLDLVQVYVTLDRAGFVGAQSHESVSSGAVSSSSSFKLFAATLLRLVLCALCTMSKGWMVFQMLPGSLAVPTKAVPRKSASLPRFLPSILRATFGLQRPCSWNRTLRRHNLCGVDECFCVRFHAESLTHSGVQGSWRAWPWWLGC
eukprot:3394714-Rhodomonas_salina.1